MTLFAGAADYAPIRTLLARAGVMRPTALRTALIRDFSLAPADAARRIAAARAAGVLSYDAVTDVCTLADGAASLVEDPSHVSD